jgi:hypothetical protein
LNPKLELAEVVQMIPRGVNMRNLITIVLLAFASWVSAEEVTLKDGAISFTVPKGFRAQSAEEISLKFPRGNAPAVVYANSNGGVSIAVTFSPAKVTRDQLPELKASMEQMLPRLIPNLQWLTREIIVSNGTPWVHLELTSSAVDTDIHNHMYFTSHQGHMLGFNFNSTTGAFPSYSKSLLDSFKSIRLRE